MLNGVPFFNAVSLVKVGSAARKGQQQSRHERQRNAGFSTARDGRCCIGATVGGRDVDAPFELIRIVERRACSRACSRAQSRA
jgi:hypothetical protein